MTETGLRVCGGFITAFSLLGLVFGALTLYSGEAIPALLVGGLSGLISGLMLLGFAEVLERLRQLVTSERPAPPPAEASAPTPRHRPTSGQGKLFRRLGN